METDYMLLLIPDDVDHIEHIEMVCKPTMSENQKQEIERLIDDVAMTEDWNSPSLQAWNEYINQLVNGETRQTFLVWVKEKDCYKMQ